MVSTNSASVDCIVRLHDPGRLDELSRCIFSLVSQEHQPVHIILVTQRFTAAELGAVKRALEPLLRGAPTSSLEVLNYSSSTPRDARTALLNLGLAHTRGGYVGFLDYDDVLYPEAYGLLRQALADSGAAIAFGGIRVVEADLHPGWLHTRRVLAPPFQGSTLWDLFRANFCPIHSYLIDRSALEPGFELAFDEAVTIEEDYDFLLHLCARHRSDFSLTNTTIGDYTLKSDGSNTIHAGNPGQLRFDYEWVSALIEVRRQTTVVSAAVLEQLGLAQRAGHWTIRMLLDEQEN